MLYGPQLRRASWRLAVMLAVIGLVAVDDARAEDLVEFINGSKAHGKLLEIRKADKEFDFELQIGSRSFKRTYPYAKVHAVTINGRRHVINELPAAGTAASGSGKRSRSEIEQLIREVGSTAPDWFEATAVEHPRTLDLDWPLQLPKKGWNNQVNMGQYLWDVIYPNPGRWRSGVRLVHHLMERHQGNRALLQRDMRTLGSIYFRLFQDYPRAAFWLRKAPDAKGTSNSVMLAECYYRMGNRQMALEQLDTRTLSLSAIKLLGDIGETQRAVQLANAFAKSGRTHEAYLLAGDACRTAGRNSEAVAFYQKVIDDKQARNKDYLQRYQAGAQESIAAIRLADHAKAATAGDGKYLGRSTGYNGTLEVEVTVAAGKITAAKVVKHQEKQFYSALTDTTQQILDKQSVTGIDATSRATITSQAIVNAAAKALADANGS